MAICSMRARWTLLTTMRNYAERIRNISSGQVIGSSSIIVHNKPRRNRKCPCLANAREKTREKLSWQVLLLRDHQIVTTPYFW